MNQLTITFQSDGENTGDTDPAVLAGRVWEGFLWGLAQHENPRRVTAKDNGLEEKCHLDH